MPNPNWETDEDGNPINPPAQEPRGQRGIMANLHYLMGTDREAAAAIQPALNHRMQAIRLVDGDPGEVQIDFRRHRLTLWDRGQSCCESRYIRTDDDLAYFAGAMLRNIEISAAEEIADSVVHDIQFLRIITDRGTITFVNHNEHNGCYGGFVIDARLEEI